MNGEASLFVRAMLPKLKCAQGPGDLPQLSAWGPRLPGPMLLVGGLPRGKRLICRGQSGDRSANNADTAKGHDSRGLLMGDG